MRWLILKTEERIALKKTIHDFSGAVFEMAVGLGSQLPVSDLEEVVFCGRSNVGKSSLINKVLKRKAIARVSSTPGKTGTINFYKVENLRLVDLPGYGYAKVPFSEKKRWAELMEFYFNSNRNIKLVIQIIDMRHAPTKQDLQMMEFLFSRNFNFLIVMTKSDKLNKTKRLERLSNIETELSEFNSVRKIIFSSITGEGLEDVREVIFSGQVQKNGDKF